MSQLREQNGVSRRAVLKAVAAAGLGAGLAWRAVHAPGRAVAGLLVGAGALEVLVDDMVVGLPPKSPPRPAT